MSNPERGTNEFDPSYDPERVSGDGEHERREDEIFHDHELYPGDENPSVELNDDDGLVFRIDIPEYNLLNIDGNPYRYDASPRQSLQPVATALETFMTDLFEDRHILVRGIQSARHPYTIHQLVEYIKEHGTDRYSASSVIAANAAAISVDLYAAHFLPWTRDSSFLGLFEGFHTYKPKCDEVPQTPIDIVMVYDAGSYDQIEYVNQRHGGIGHDAYKLKQGVALQQTLLAIILINDANYDNACYSDAPDSPVVQ